VKRTREVAVRTALAMAALTVSLAGCSALSPRVINTPYPASDGVQLNLPGGNVKLRDFLVVGSAQGSPAEVIGSVINDGPSPVQVSLQSDPGPTAQPTQTLVRVEAHGSVQIGPDQAIQMEIPELPVPPGAATAISAATASGGTASFQVPVLPPVDAYANLTAPPTTAAAPSPTKTPKDTTSSPDDSPTTEPTETATSN
jgi:hypothetical protein